MELTNKKHKHLTLDDRIEIQECLSKGMTFKAIGRRIGKDQTTVSKEVKAHLQTHTNSFVQSDLPCPRLLKAPFVCNGCEQRSRSSCPHVRQLYIAKKAQNDYETLLTEAREGIPLNKESFYQTERIVSQAVRDGQHIYHVIATHHLPVSTATVYRHIRRGYYAIAPIDLPRAVKFKPRHSKPNEFVPRAFKQGRTYADYLNFTADFPALQTVQLDTVIGRIGGKVIMTIHFVQSNFMAGLLMENKTAVEAASSIRSLKERLKQAGFSFGDVIPLMLTDNGGEFSMVSAFENDPNGTMESHLFFCDPCSPYEKPHIEKNHSLFRDILPSGSSFDSLTQQDIDLVFSHVNAVRRKQFNGKSAYDLFTFMFSPQLAACLGIRYIPPDQVIQSPRLFR